MPRLCVWVMSTTIACNVERGDRGRCCGSGLKFTGGLHENIDDIEIIANDAQKFGNAWREDNGIVNAPDDAWCPFRCGLCMLDKDRAVQLFTALAWVMPQSDVRKIFTQHWEEAGLAEVAAKVQRSFGAWLSGSWLNAFGAAHLPKCAGSKIQEPL